MPTDKCKATYSIEAHCEPTLKSYLKGGAEGRVEYLNQRANGTQLTVTK